MIMSINGYIINRQMKLMEMGWREEILLEIISTNLIIQGILPEVIATRSINPSLKRSIVYKGWFIFIHAQRFISYWIFIGDERLEEDCRYSRRRYVVRDNFRSRERNKWPLHLWIPVEILDMKILHLCRVNLWSFWDGHVLVFLQNWGRRWLRFLIQKVCIPKMICITSPKGWLKIILKMLWLVILE